MSIACKLVDVEPRSMIELHVETEVKAELKMKLKVNQSVSDRPMVKVTLVRL